MSLGKKVFTSASLLLLRKIWGNIVNLFVMAFLARLLTKEDFGLLAISSVFIGIINTMATAGISEYIVYYDGEDKEKVLNAAFWLNLFLTVAVIGVVLITGPLWADFYKNEKVYSLMLLLLVAFFFEMGITIPQSILRKELEYKSIVFYSSISMTAISIGKLGAAWAGFGVYSLALPQAFVSPFLMIAFFVKTRWRPALNLGVTYYRQIFHYTKHIVGGRVLTKLVNEGDNLIVGKLIGLEGLGIYALAFQLANLVTRNVVSLVNDIFQPLFSKVRGEPDRLRVVYMRMIQFLSFISFPLITALIISADSIVFFIYGEKWMDAVLPFQILCVFALGRSISSPSSSLFSAMGRPDIGFKFTLYFTPIFLLSVYYGSLYNVIGVAVATTIVRVAGSVVSLSLSLSLIQLKLRDLYNSIKSNLNVTFIMLIVFSWAFINFFDQQRLLLLIGLPIIVYVHFLIQRFFYQTQLVSFFSEIGKYVPNKFLNKILYTVFFIKPAL